LIFKSFSVFLGLLLSVFPCLNNASDKINIGIVGKTKNDSFYQQSYQGCLSFAQENPNVNCIYEGGNDYQDIRAQALILNKLVQQGVDGLLFSTTDSDFLVQRVLSSNKARNLPIITFDSDLLPEHRQYRIAYVGTDNFNFGQALARYAKQFKTSKITRVCIQSGHNTSPNLNERLAGVRYELAGERTERLNGQNGWIEHERCPFYSLGKRGDALMQLEAMLNEKNPPIFIAVAGFAQFNPDYIERISAYKTDIDKGDIVIVSADTETVQLEALAAGLSTVNIGQNPFEMGRLGTELLYRHITTNQPIEKSNYFLDYHYCMQSNIDSCMNKRVKKKESLK